MATKRILLKAFQTFQWSCTYRPSFPALTTSYEWFWLLMFLILTFLAKSWEKMVKMGKFSYRRYTPCWLDCDNVEILPSMCRHRRAVGGGRCLDMITCLHCDILVHFSEQVIQQFAISDKVHSYIFLLPQLEIFSSFDYIQMLQWV